MPILRYFAVVGSVLMALLFYADAELPKTGPIAFGSQVVDLPGAQRAHAPMGSTLVAAMAPAPDMNSSLVRAAEPPAAVQTADAKPSANEAAMVADASPPVPAKTAARTVPVKKKKHVARRAAPRPDRDDFYDTRHYASRGFDNGGGFFGGGGGLFGRF